MSSIGLKFENLFKNGKQKKFFSFYYTINFRSNLIILLSLNSNNIVHKYIQRKHMDSHRCVSMMRVFSALKDSQRYRLYRSNYLS